MGDNEAKGIEKKSKADKEKIMAKDNNINEMKLVTSGLENHGVGPDEHKNVKLSAKVVGELDVLKGQQNGILNLKRFEAMVNFLSFYQEKYLDSKKQEAIQRY